MTARPNAPAERRASPADVTVRIATPGDLEAVVALRLALLREHGANPLYRRLRRDAPARARRLFAAQLDTPREAIFLAERGSGDIVGVLRCVEAYGLPLLFPARYAYISSVYVRPELRRCGLLRALLAAADGWARERGLREMRLHNAVENEAACAAWSALGFEVAEQLRVRQLD